MLSQEQQSTKEAQLNYKAHCKSNSDHVNELAKLNIKAIIHGAINNKVFNCDRLTIKENNKVIFQTN